MKHQTVEAVRVDGLEQPSLDGDVNGQTARNSPSAHLPKRCRRDR